MLSAVAELSDLELLERVPVLAQREREATAELVAHLAVLDERRLYLGEGCSSLFTYCTRVLHLSENAAYRRVEAARVIRRYPVILDMLAEGSTSLTTIRLLAPELTPANHQELLEQSRNQTTRQVERSLRGYGRNRPCHRLSVSCPPELPVSCSTLRRELTLSATRRHYRKCRSWKFAPRQGPWWFP